MSRYSIFFYFLFWGFIPLYGQEGAQALKSPTPLSRDFLSKAYYGNVAHPHQAFLGIQTLPAYHFASSWQMGMARKVTRVQSTFGLQLTGLNIGPYHELQAGLLLRREFTKHVAALIRPTWSRVGVTAYGSGSFIGGEIGIQYTMDGWEIACMLEKTSLQKDNSSSMVFAWSYRLSSDYGLNLFVKSQKLHALQYGTELSYSKTEHQILILGLASTIHPYLRYQYQKGKYCALISLHYSPVWGLSPDNAYGYAW